MGKGGCSSATSLEVPQRCGWGVDDGADGHDQPSWGPHLEVVVRVRRVLLLPVVAAPEVVHREEKRRVVHLQRMAESGGSGLRWGWRFTMSFIVMRF